jgi:hypothetical protein
MTIKEEEAVQRMIARLINEKYDRIFVEWDYKEYTAEDREREAQACLDQIKLESDDNVVYTGPFE